VPIGRHYGWSVTPGAFPPGLSYFLFNCKFIFSPELLSVMYGSIRPDISVHVKLRISGGLILSQV
jgi:hypothetical protein